MSKTYHSFLQSAFWTLPGCGVLAMATVLWVSRVLGEPVSW